MNILIVDDKEEGRYLLETLFKGGGHNVTAVANGAEAIEKLKSGGFELIISDILMPIMDGFELCRKVKADEALRHIPFIIYTATYTDPQDEVYALKIGADRFIQKPCEPEVFLAAMQETMTAARRQGVASLPGAEREEEVLKLYSERLVKKLEDKMIQLERGEKTLRESDEKYRILAENSLQGLLVIQEFRIVFANQTLAEISGYTVEELLSFPPEKVIAMVHPKDQSLVWGRFRDRLAGKTVPSRYEYRGIRKDGAVTWLEMFASSIEFRGKPAIQGAVIDITERKQAEEELLKEKKFSDTAINSLPGIFYLIDEKGRFLRWNTNLCVVTGYSNEEISTMHPLDFFTGEEKQKARAAIQEVFSKGESSIEARLTSKDRKETPYFFTGRLFISDNQKYLIGMGINISESKKAETALRESEEKFRELYDHAPVGYHEFDIKGRITSVNQTELEMLGYRLKEIIGRPVWSFVTEEEESKQAVLTKLTGVFPSGKQFERTYRRKDGTTFRALIEDRPLHDSHGKIIGIRSTIQDITERKRAEQEMVSLQEQLRQSQRMEAIGRLAGGIAHDFNNLLTVIRGNSQLSLFDLREGDPLKANIEGIRNASEKASDLIKQLLAFSRKQIMEMQVLDLNLILMRIDPMLHRILGEDIELVTLLTEGIGKIKADPGQIEQVIINLAVNSRDAMPNGGKLTIETANVELDEEYTRKYISVHPGQYVMLSVSDTGTGMAPEVKEKVFEPFFTTKEIGKGTGLGLSTVYGIVKQSEGNIWVYSEPGQGTTFKIYLPQVDEPLTELKEEVSKEIPHGNETILIVEDEEAVRILVARILKGLGYRILDAPEGGSALILYEEFKEPIHLILTDVVMPGMSGRTLVERLKKSHREMKVLYMSGYTDSSILHHGVLEKGTNFIQKPFTLENLAKKVREVLDKD